MKTPNWKELNLKGHCYTCKHYVPLVKKGVRTARGSCRLTDKYKQRTESCKKYVEEIT